MSNILRKWKNNTAWRNAKMKIIINHIIKPAFVMVFAFMLLFGITKIKAYAAENTIDATKTDPYTYKIDADKTSIVIPMAFSKAGVYTYKINATNFSEEVHVTFLKNENLTSENDIATIATFKGTEHEFTKVIKEPITYYVWIYSENPPAIEKNVTVTCACYEPETTSREVKEGEDVKAISSDRLKYTMTLSTDSIVTLTADNSVTIDTDKTTVNYAKKGEPAVAYMKKGTYHLEVGSGITNFKYTTQPLTLGKNVTKKKAKTMKVGKAESMKFAASNGKDTTYYYKFKLKKAKKISININAPSLLSNVNVRLYKTKFNKVPYLEGYNENNKGKAELRGQVKKGSYAANAVLFQKSVKLPAGTYYLEVSNQTGGDCKVTVK